MRYSELPRERQADLYATALEALGYNAFTMQTSVMMPLNKEFKFNVSKSIPQEYMMGMKDGQVIDYDTTRLAVVDFTKNLKTAQIKDYTPFSNMYGETVTYNLIHNGDVFNADVLALPLHRSHANDFVHGIVEDDVAANPSYLSRFKKNYNIATMGNSHVLKRANSRTQYATLLGGDSNPHLGGISTGNRRNFWGALQYDVDPVYKYRMVEQNFVARAVDTVVTGIISETTYIGKYKPKVIVRSDDTNPTE
jgi:hypothetical protein